MNFKTKFAASLLFTFALFFSVSAQTTGANNDSVRDLRKSLIKNSRYQFQEIILQFVANDFKSCDVSYRFERSGSLGNENFGQATVDRSSPVAPSINNTSTTRTVFSPITGNTAGQISNGNPSFLLRELTFFNTTTITSLNFSDLDAQAIEIKTSPRGVFLSLKTLESKSSIQKKPTGNGALPLKTSFEFLPIVSQKKAEKVKELLVRAIRQCSEQN